VRVFRREDASVTNWSQLGNAIDGVAAGGRLHLSDLSADGKTVAVGAWNHDNNGADNGHVRVMRYSENTWWQVGDDIDWEPTNLSATDNDGSLALSAEGDTLVVGSPYYQGINGKKSGYVRVYHRDSSDDNTEWMQVGDTIYGAAARDLFGKAVDLSADGATLIVGAPSESDFAGISGYARTFEIEASCVSSSTDDTVDSAGGEPPKQSDEGLLIGALLGIVFGCVALVAAGIGVGLVARKKSHQKDQQSVPRPPSSNLPQENQSVIAVPWTNDLQAEQQPPAGYLPAYNDQVRNSTNQQQSEHWGDHVPLAEARVTPQNPTSNQFLPTFKNQVHTVLEGPQHIPVENILPLSAQPKQSGRPPVDP